MRPSLRLAGREILRSGPQAALFVAATTLALVTLVSLGGLARSVRRGVLRDARELHAADVIAHRHRDFSPALLAATGALAASGEAETARLWDFFSMARAPGGGRPVLASVLVAPDAYPFYGTVLLASGRPFPEVHAPGGAIVEQGLLDRLGLRVGDPLLLGEATLQVRDVLVREPDRPVAAFALGPRIIAHAADLAALGLVTEGSRVDHRLLLRVARDERIDAVAARLRAAAAADERVETYRTARSGVKRFFDNFLFFLSLIGIFTLLLAGFGIQSSLAALLREKRDTLAVMRAVGATPGFVARQAALMVLLLAAAGTGLGVAGGALLGRLLPPLFRGFLPAEAAGVPAGAVLEGLLIGAVTAAVFTALPLARLREVRPAAVVGREALPPGRRLPGLVRGALVALLAAGLVFAKIDDRRTGLWFVLGVGGLILVAAGSAALLLRLVRSRRPGRLVPRLVLRGLERPGSGVLVTLTTLVASLAVILAVRVVELNVDRSLVRSYPPDAPNLYLVDIQPSQRDAVAAALGPGAELFPIVRARVASVAGEAIDARAERASRGDNFGREFNLTYRDTLLEDERVSAGPGLFDPADPGPQVSVLEDVLEMRRIRLGDEIVFTVGGLPLAARVTSLRTRTRSSVRPFFYFVLPPALLADAPQTIFAAARVDRARIAGLQAELAARFPNVTTVDLTETVAIFAGVMGRLARIVRLFAWFSIAAGLLVVTSAVLATRQARLRESVYYRLLGARRSFVLRVFAAEHLLIAGAAAALALGLAELAGWAVCARVLGIGFHPFAGSLAATAALAALLVVATGLLGTLPALGVRPATYLREVTAE